MPCLTLVYVEVKWRCIVVGVVYESTMQFHSTNILQHLAFSFINLQIWQKFIGLRLWDTVESASKMNNARQNSFHHKACTLCAHFGFLLDCGTNLPPTEAACTCNNVIILTSHGLLFHKKIAFCECWNELLPTCTACKLLPWGIDGRFWWLLDLEWAQWVVIWTILQNWVWMLEQEP